MLPTFSSNVTPENRRRLLRLLILAAAFGFAITKFYQRFANKSFNAKLFRRRLILWLVQWFDHVKHEHQMECRPQRIILIRHGESEGNQNAAIYTETPDHKIGLTEAGRQQAREAGAKIRQMIGDEKLYVYYSPFTRCKQTLEGICEAFESCNDIDDDMARDNQSAYGGTPEASYSQDEDVAIAQMSVVTRGRIRAWASLYTPNGSGIADLDKGSSAPPIFGDGDDSDTYSDGSDTTIYSTRFDDTIWPDPNRSTFLLKRRGSIANRVGGGYKAWARYRSPQIVAKVEDPRLREQEWGNVQCSDQMDTLRKIRSQVGRFYFRFPTGEAGSDVYDRVSIFLQSLYRNFMYGEFSNKPNEKWNVLIVTHGLFMRLFLHRYFRWTVDKFESVYNFPNCGLAVLQKRRHGKAKGAFQLITPLPDPPHLRRRPSANHKSKSFSMPARMNPNGEYIRDVMTNVFSEFNNTVLNTDGTNESVNDEKVDDNSGDITDTPSPIHSPEQLRHSKKRPSYHVLAHAASVSESNLSSPKHPSQSSMNPPLCETVSIGGCSDDDEAILRTISPKA